MVHTFYLIHILTLYMFPIFIYISQNRFYKEKLMINQKKLLRLGPRPCFAAASFPWCFIPIMYHSRDVSFTFLQKKISFRIELFGKQNFSKIFPDVQSKIRHIEFSKIFILNTILKFKNSYLFQCRSYLALHT